MKDVILLSVAIGVIFAVFVMPASSPEYKATMLDLLRKDYSFGGLSQLVILGVVVYGLFKLRG